MRTCGTFGLLLFPYSVERGVVEQSRELCGIGHDRGFGLGDLRFNFHAVSIAERVRHPLSYPKDFCDLFQKPRDCDEGGFVRHLAAMLTAERSVFVSDLMNRLGEVGVASEYAEVTHSRNFRFRGFNLDPVQFRFHAQRITETETNTRKIAKYFHPPFLKNFGTSSRAIGRGGLKIYLSHPIKPSF